MLFLTVFKKLRHTHPARAANAFGTAICVRFCQLKVGKNSDKTRKSKNKKKEQEQEKEKKKERKRKKNKKKKRKKKKKPRDWV